MISYNMNTDAKRRIDEKSGSVTVCNIICTYTIIFFSFLCLVVITLGYFPGPVIHCFGQMISTQKFNEQTHR